MATAAPTYCCMICGGQLEWEAVPQCGEPRFAPTDWRQKPHECPVGAVDKWRAKLGLKNHVIRRAQVPDVAAE